MMKSSGPATDKTWIYWVPTISLAALGIFLIPFSWLELHGLLHKAGWYQCPLKSLTSLTCGFCGMTHAWLAALKGEWIQSFQFNPLGIPLMVFGGILPWIWARYSAHARKMFWIWIGLLVLLMAARNFATIVLGYELPS